MTQAVVQKCDLCSEITVDFIGMNVSKRYVEYYVADKTKPQQ